jgi:hypothetical protein
VRTKKAERAFLAPLGLTMDTFLASQSGMSPDVVTKLTTEIINFSPGDIEAIVAGIDETGAHLWVVKNEDTTCFDRAGFAAIGAGEWHAKSAFMFNRYTRYRALPQALLLTYAAKKRAEVAPGVGVYSDMFSLGPSLGMFYWVPDGILARLEDIYQRIRQEEQRIIQQANLEAIQYVEEMSRAATAKEQTALPEDGGGDTPPDQTQLPSGSEEEESEDGSGHAASN